MVSWVLRTKANEKSASGFVEWNFVISERRSGLHHKRLQNVRIRGIQAVGIHSDFKSPSASHKHGHKLSIQPVQSETKRLRFLRLRKWIRNIEVFQRIPVVQIISSNLLVHFPRVRISAEE